MKQLNTNFLNKSIILLFIITIYTLLSLIGAFDFLKSVMFGLIPFFIAFFIAWLLRPIAKKLKNILKCSLRVSNLISILISGTILILILFFLIPNVFMQASFLFNGFPEMTESIIKNLESLNQGNFFDNKEISNYISSIFTFNGFNLYVNSAVDIIGILVNAFGGIVSVISKIFFGFIIAFFIVDDFGQLNKSFINVIFSKKEETYYKINEISNALYGYVRGTAIVCSTVFLIISLGSYFIGLPSPFLFATVAAIFNVIPYVGPYLAAIPIVAVGFSINPMTALLAFGLVVITQFVEAYFLQPKIMSKTTNLHPVTIIVGLLIFHSLFGIVGMIIGTPIIVVIAKLLSFTNLDVKL